METLHDNNSKQLGGHGLGNWNQKVKYLISQVSKLVHAHFPRGSSLMTFTPTFMIANRDGSFTYIIEGCKLKSEKIIVMK